MAKTSCKKGQYYCNTDQKCKPIPDGYKVREDGILVSEGSLHKWFSGSKSKDGKPGWVNVTTGGTCASDEPGEGVPKCVSRSKYESMTPAERRSASRRKKDKDKGQQSKRNAAKPTYVKTDKEIQEMTYKKKKKKKIKEEFISLPLVLEVPQNDGEFKLGLMFRESLEQDRGMLFIFESDDYWTFHMKNTFIPLDIAFIKEDGTIESIKELDPMNSIPVGPDSEIRYAIEVNRGWFAENGVVVGDRILEEEEELTEGKDKKGKGSGTKDACYNKVKSRYSVWPSAYASGALVKCRKVGAANWGNSKKEDVEYKGEDIQELAPLALAAKGLGMLKGAAMTKGGLFTLGLGSGLGGALPAIIAPKTMTTLAGLGLATQGAGVVKQTVRKQAADKENQNLRMRMGMGEGKKEHYDWRSTLDEKMTDDEFRETEALMTRNALTGGKLLKNKKQGEKFQNKYVKELSRRATSVGDGTQFKVDRGPEKNYGDNKITVNKKTVAKNFPNLKDHYDWRETLDEKCWKGYEKKGMKTMFGKRYPNCVKKTKKEELEVEASSVEEKKEYNPNAKKDDAFDRGVDKQLGLIPLKKIKKEVKKIDEKLVHGNFGNFIKGQKLIKTKEKKYKEPPYKDLAASVDLEIAMKEDTAIESELTIQDWNIDEIKYTEIEAVDIIKPEPLKPSPSNWRADLGEDWQKVNKRDNTDGMSQKAVDAYKRENPGSELKTAVTGEVKKGSKDAKRRSSYCSRSEGQKKMHNIDCTKTPDKAICKARRRWKC